MRSVTVIAPTSTLAEGLTKSVFIMGPERGLALVESQPDVDAVVVTAEGRVLYSKGWRRRGTSFGAGVRSSRTRPRRRSG